METKKEKKVTKKERIENTSRVIYSEIFPNLKGTHQVYRDGSLGDIHIDCGKLYRVVRRAVKLKIKEHGK